MPSYATVKRWTSLTDGGYRVTRQTTSPLVVLGSGYTGRVLYKTGASQGWTVYATSRNPLNNLMDIPSEHRLMFDLDRPSTWRNIPMDTDLIWCFPATPLEQVQAFAHTLNPSTRRIVVLGSTSAYGGGESQEYPPPWIDETSLINMNKPRVQGEEYLRNTVGAIVLRVAGIYGPGRNPLDWIRQGRVGLSRKYVNLIHAEDLAAICLAAIEKGKPGEAYNVSDGRPYTWNEICATAQQRWGVTAVAAGTEGPSSGKRISNAKLRTELGYTLKHPDLYEALTSIESADRVAAQDGQSDFRQGPRREGTGDVSSGVR